MKSVLRALLDVMFRHVSFTDVPCIWRFWCSDTCRSRIRKQARHVKEFSVDRYDPHQYFDRVGSGRPEILIMRCVG